MKKLLLLAACSLMLTGCVQFNPPVVKYVDTRVTAVTLEGANINFIFEVTNPNPLPMDIKKYSYKVQINGRELIAQTNNGFTVLANETKQIKLPLFVRYDRVVDSLLSVAVDIAMGRMYFDYKVDGSVDAGTLGISMTVPFGTQGRIQIPKELLVR